MSFVGKNIKKIRSLKKISQTEFAKIFDLTRGTIGAYEEERAEPKIDTLVHLANYFGLSVDAFINKELTVSDLYSLNVVNEKLNEAHHFKKESTPAYKKGGIELVRINDHLEYVVNRDNKDFIRQLSRIDFPVDFKGSKRAFELNGSEMEYQQNGLHHGDILLCKDCAGAKSKAESGKVYVLVAERVMVRRLKSNTENSMVFQTDDPNYEDNSINHEDVKELWEVKGVYSTYLNPPKMIDERVMLLERKMEELERKLK